MVAHGRAVAALEQATPLFDTPSSREVIDFKGSQLVALFRTPHGAGPHPTVLLIPGLDSTKEEFRDVERSFLDRGMATFALDGPGQGEAEWTTADPARVGGGGRGRARAHARHARDRPRTYWRVGREPRGLLRGAPGERGPAYSRHHRARRTVQLGRHVEGPQSPHSPRLRSPVVLVVPPKRRSDARGT